MRAIDAEINAIKNQLIRLWKEMEDQGYPEKKTEQLSNIIGRLEHWQHTLSITGGTV